MEFELKGALKKYRWMRSSRHAGMAIAAPWLLDFGRTETLICSLGALVVVMTGQLEMRLKTIQIRLAGMDDQLNALNRGDPLQSPKDNLILESTTGDVHCSARRRLAPSRLVGATRNLVRGSPHHDQPCPGPACNVHQQATFP